MQSYKKEFSADSKYILRCIDLARRGLGYTLSNPLVGCVIVHKNKIISEGWHKVFGGPHAEVNAINSLNNKNILPECTLYVNLEPCVHYGKTPPCVDLIINWGIKRVVVGCLDTNPLVAGKGVEKLRNNGIEVVTGVEEIDCYNLNAVFFTGISKQRPYIVIKWATTADGYMATLNKSSKRISNTISEIYTHRLRAATQAILVGYKTILHDDPQLNVRLSKGNSPIPVVIDPGLKLNLDYKIFTDLTRPAWIMNTIKEGEEGHNRYFKCSKDNLLNDIFGILYSQNITSVLVEGGRSTLDHLIKGNLWEEAWVYTGAENWNQGWVAPKLPSSPVLHSKMLDNSFTLYNNS